MVRVDKTIFKVFQAKTIKTIEPLYWVWQGSKACYENALKVWKKVLQIFKIIPEEYILLKKPSLQFEIVIVIL